MKNKFGNFAEWTETRRIVTRWFLAF
jgi:hypothetical protein